MVDGTHGDAYARVVEGVGARIRAGGTVRLFLEDMVAVLQTCGETRAGRMWLLGWTLYVHRGVSWGGLLGTPGGPDTGTRERYVLGNVCVCVSDRDSVVRGGYFLEHVHWYMVQTIQTRNTVWEMMEQLHRWMALAWDIARYHELEVARGKVDGGDAVLAGGGAGGGVDANEDGVGGNVEGGGAVAVGGGREEGGDDGLGK